MDAKIIQISSSCVGEYKLVKLMNPEEFAAKIAIERIDLGLSLPYGTVTTLYSKTGEGEKISMAVLKQKRKQMISVNNRTRTGENDIQMFEFNFPQLMFFMDYNLSNGQVTNTHIYMLDPKLEIMDVLPGQVLELCAFPMPNLHDDHRPCMGSQDAAINKDPKKFIENFYTGVWNSDLEGHMAHFMPASINHQVMGQNSLSGKIMKLNNEWMNPLAVWTVVAKFKMPLSAVTMNADFNVLEVVR